MASANIEVINQRRMTTWKLSKNRGFYLGQIMPHSLRLVLSARNLCETLKTIYPHGVPLSADIKPMLVLYELRQDLITGHRSLYKRWVGFRPFV